MRGGRPRLPRSYLTAEPTATIRLETCSEVPAEILNRMTVGRFDRRTRNRCTSVVLVHPLEPLPESETVKMGRCQICIAIR